MRQRAWLLGAWTCAIACGAPAPQLASEAGCLPGGDGYLRARMRGALDLDIDWRNAELVCEGGVRPGNRGIRLAFAGPQRSDGRRVRVVFGVAGAREGRTGRALPTNLTIIFEGEKRIFATRGDDKCTIDELRQERVGPLAGLSRTYRVIGRGFCTEPATAADQSERLVVSRFDFAGLVAFGDEEAADTLAGPP